MRRGVVPSTGRLTLGRHLADWLESIRFSVRPGTYLSYENHVTLHLAALANVPIIALQPVQVRTLNAQLLAEGLAPATVVRILTTLRMALKQAVADGILERNVAQLVTPPRVPRTEIVPFTLEQARAFLDAVRGDRLEALYALVLAVGLRQGEALGLRWSHVDLEGAEIRVTASLRPIDSRFREDKRRGTRLQLVEPKTPSGRRVVPLPLFVIVALREHKVRQLEEQLAAGPRWRGNKLGLVFTTPVGTPLDPRNVSRAYREVLDQAELPPLRFHDLRHSAATIMLAAGFNLKTISEILGHRTAGMSELYAHVLPSMKEEVAVVVDQLLGQREAK
jgi:integrase